MKKPLMPVEDAIVTIVAAAKPKAGSEIVSLAQSLGRVLVADQQSTIDVPPCDNSAMDGYAIHFADLDNPAELLVAQRIPAGQIGNRLERGTAARIFTGAPIPEGADTVIMQEDTELHNDKLRVIGQHRQGQNIRPRGQDIAAHSVVVHSGRRIQPQDVGLLASIGVTEVPVYPQLKVAIVSTGNELVEPGQPLGQGQIYNSNRYTLSALLVALGCEVIDGGIVEDDFAATQQRLQKLAGKADIIVSSGGVSVGEEDHVKAVVESLGHLDLWKLNIKPGKPLAFGKVGDVPFFGLPGNPSSVFVTFCLLARPFILRCQGQEAVAPLVTEATADFDWQRAGTRQEYLRAKVGLSAQHGPAVSLYGNQSSGVLASVSWANALVVIPPGTTVAAGDRVSVILLSDLVG